MFEHDGMLKDSNDMVAPPAKRGPIKALAKFNQRQSSQSPKSVGDVKAFIGKALSGKIRSYLQVQVSAEDRKRLWAEVTLKMSKHHLEIVTAVRDAVLTGDVQNQASAKEMCRKLVTSFGA